MVYDYLGLGKEPRTKRLSKKDDGFLNMGSDHLGLAKFASNNAKDVRKARGFVKREVKDYKTAYKEVRNEVQAFKKDVGRGGWIGDYIRRKTAKPKPRKFANSKF